MLDYEWENPPVMMISGQEPDSATDAGHSPRQFVDHYAASQASFFQFHPGNCLISSQSALFSHHNSLQRAAQSHIQSLYDHPTDLTASDFTPHSLLSLDPVVGLGPDSGPGFLLVPKSEDSRPPAGMEFASRIGLNLGRRTYFSSEEDDFINRLYRRSGPAESGLANSPKCQAEGCDADLSHSKHYYRRHKVCEFHSKAPTVIAAGLTQRFCQQCSRFHLLAEFDNGKRSCRKRLADHNRRRRKTHQSNQASQKSQPQIPWSSDNLTRLPADSGAQSSSSVTVATSPTRRMPFHGFTQRLYPAITSSASSSSIFLSNG